ncbi:MarR family winged helix-turn-helix transcriptional regulator [Rarobacter incanus]|uniref:DNA-binding MarR family transcriptional regulator n=1 Tax=Rarobacter incanus TaxID=153494 RepID=A0A542SNN4_9MICO|nr:MarR family transcriptional regulator [Rarobacter incanus]TQK76155.1 DNA-binding MarR family transcriptional regulator [Rarobacter incanus]
MTEHDKTPLQAHSPASANTEVPSPLNILGRLMYLTILMRVTDGRFRHGHGRSAGVLKGQGRALRILQLQSPISQKELAYLLGIRSQSLSELITKLEDGGLVKRSPDPGDGRTWLVEITELGREAAGAQPNTLEEDPTFGLSDDEAAQLTALLDKVIENVEESAPIGADRRIQKMRQMWFEAGASGDRRAGGFGPGFGPDYGEAFMGAHPGRPRGRGRQGRSRKAAEGYWF